MLLTGPKGHNSGAPSMTGVGLVYLMLNIIWTLLLFFLVMKNVRNRDCYAVKIRGLKLMIAQVAIIHIYVSAIFIVYPLNGAYTCDSEFWMMNTVFPGGVALFQASTVRLLAVHENQTALYEAESAEEVNATVGRVKHPYLRNRSIHAQNLKLTVHYSWIAVAFCMQLLLALILFLGSHRFGTSKAYFGEPADAFECRRGWEWAPSIAWQFFFTWIYAPYLLFKAWRIKDIYLWSMQTMLCVIFGLPGTPLWLATLYGPEQVMAWFYAYMPPATWFAPGLMAMELTTLLMPIISSTRSQSMENARSNLVLAYEAVMNSQKKVKADHACKIRCSLINNRAAMNYQLEDHPGNTPFAKFCAQKAFVYHTVLFIRGTQSFKQSFSFGSDIDEQFDHAAYLWFVLGDMDTSPFGGVNVPWIFTKFMRDLFSDVVFEPSTPEPINNAAPWENTDPPGYESGPGSPVPLNNVVDPEALPRYAQFDVRSFGKLKRADGFVVPDLFLPAVFDSIREHILDTFFQGPWRNYVLGVSREELYSWPNDRFVPKDEEHPAHVAAV